MLPRKKINTVQIKKVFFDGNFENFALQINLASYHPANSSEYNQFNRGISIEYHYDSFFLAGVISGTAYTGTVFMPAWVKKLHLGVPSG